LVVPALRVNKALPSNTNTNSFFVSPLGKPHHMIVKEHHLGQMAQPADMSIDL
jgi:hypothetical protein